MGSRALLYFLMCSSFLLINSIKVSLAAQTLSNSVAVALRTLQDVGYAEFKDCEATSELIKVMQLGFASLTKNISQHSTVNFLTTFEWLIALTTFNPFNTHPPFVVDMLVSYPKTEHFGIRNDSINMTLLKFNTMQELG